MKSSKFVFDLDDTLYSELDYVYSALNFAAAILSDWCGTNDCSEELLRLYDSGSKDPVGEVMAQFELAPDKKPELLELMQAHAPNIALSTGANLLLGKLRDFGSAYSIVTDGRSSTQRAKIVALGLHDAEYVSISEETGFGKPSFNCFREIYEAYGSTDVIYAADNPSKDFVTPTKLGWSCFMVLDQGKNIHEQKSDLSELYGKYENISSIGELHCLVK